MESEFLLEVSDLAKYFFQRRGLRSPEREPVRAVDGVSFGVRPGETLGLVGESGCGKTTTARMIMSAVEPTRGAIWFDARGLGRVDLVGLKPQSLRQVRRDLQLIFQDPSASLTPHLTVLQNVGEPLLVHGLARGPQLRAAVAELLEVVGLPASALQRYPRSLSVGQRQRVVIARALALRPRLVVCDEPVSALDAPVQAQILELLRALQQQYAMAYLFIAHDLSVIAQVSERVAVMYAGKLVEIAAASCLFATPRHPYSEALIAAAAPLDAAPDLLPIGEVSAGEPQWVGCAFCPRCRYAVARCTDEEPPLREIGPSHYVRCHRAAELALQGVACDA